MTKRKYTRRVPGRYKVVKHVVRRNGATYVNYQTGVPSGLGDKGYTHVEWDLKKGTAKLRKLKDKKGR